MNKLILWKEKLSKSLNASSIISLISITISIIALSFSISSALKQSLNDNTNTYVGSTEYQEYLYNEAYVTDIYLQLKGSNMSFEQVVTFLKSKDGVILHDYGEKSFDELLPGFAPSPTFVSTGIFWVYNKADKSLAFAFSYQGILMGVYLNDYV
jgi:hypothetical protein